ncbi:MAG TPA: hypothetical protein VGG19_05710 [Tepidisphaeraceae bacterium]|jgi:hypothetical protein
MRTIDSPTQESKKLRRLPFIFASINAAISIPLVVIEIAGKLSGVKLGSPVDMPLLVLTLIDFPASLLVGSWSALLEIYSKSYENSRIAYAIFWSIGLLVCGAAWYYLVGIVVRALIRSARNRRRKRAEDIISAGDKVP